MDRRRIDAAKISFNVNGIFRRSGCCHGVNLAEEKVVRVIKFRKRQKETALFHRLVLSKDKEGILKLAKKGHQIQTPDDLSKAPYIFEFLNLPEV